MDEIENLTEADIEDEKKIDDDEAALLKELAELEDLRRRVVDLIDAEAAAKAAYEKYNPQNMPKEFFVLDDDQITQNLAPDKEVGGKGVS